MLSHPFSFSTCIASGAAQAHLEDQALVANIWKSVCQGDTSGALPIPPSFLSLSLEDSGQRVQHLAFKPCSSYLTEFKGQAIALLRV